MKESVGNRAPMLANKIWVNRISLGSLVILAPLLLFPRGILPFLAVGLAGGLAIWRWWACGRPRIGHLDIPLVYLTIMALVGLLISVERALSWPRWWALVFGLLVFAVLRSSLDLRKHTGWVAAGLALLGLGLAGVSLVGTDWSMVRLVDIPWLYDRLPTLVRSLPGSGVSPASDLFNPRWVGITMGALGPALLPLIAWRKHGWLQALAALAFLVVVGTLILTQSIQGLLGLLVGSFIVLLFVSRWFWLLLPVAGLVAVGLVLHLGVADVATTVLSLGNPIGDGVVLRLDIWSRAWAMLQDIPFTGIGLNTFPVIQSEFYTGYLIGPEPHAHNLFLQTALDLGLPGLIAFMWFLITWAYLVLKQIARIPASGCRLLLIGALAGVGSYLAHGLIDAMMLGAKPSFVIWALLGIGAAALPANPLRVKVNRLKYLIAWVWLPAACVIFAVLSPARVYMNTGGIQAQHMLHPFPAAPGISSGNLATAQLNLEKALAFDPELPQAHLLLARLASLSDNYQGALPHYQTRVALDLESPIFRYNLPRGLLQWFIPTAQPDPAEELLAIYRAWTVRFPNRAEGYLLQSILLIDYLGDIQSAQNLLKAGMQAEAQPPGLLAAMPGQ